MLRLCCHNPNFPLFPSLYLFVFLSFTVFPCTFASYSFSLSPRLTAKHGCGFYLWDTKVQLPRGGGTYPYHVNVGLYGNLLSEFADTMSARGIGHGFY